MKSLETVISEIAYRELEENFDIYEIKIGFSKTGLKIGIFLDNLLHSTGSPNISDCERYAKKLNTAFENLEIDGEKLENYFLEVSSPGAERRLRNPNDWIRFKDLPMKVVFRDEKNSIYSRVVHLIDVSNEMSEWSVDNIVYNKNQGLIFKGKNDNKLKIEIDKIESVNLYINI